LAVLILDFFTFSFATIIFKGTATFVEIGFYLFSSPLLSRFHRSRATIFEPPHEADSSGHRIFCRFPPLQRSHSEQSFSYSFGFVSPDILVVRFRTLPMAVETFFWNLMRGRFFLRFLALRGTRFSLPTCFIARSLWCPRCRMKFAYC